MQNNVSYEDEEGNDPDDLEYGSYDPYNEEEGHGF